jgi:hypothetical protein
VNEAIRSGDGMGRGTGELDLPSLSAGSRDSRLPLMTANANPGNMRQRRLAAGLTQEDVAREAHCSLAYVRLVERGYSPDPETSPAFRRLLALTMLREQGRCNSGGETG